MSWKRREWKRGSLALQTGNGCSKNKPRRARTRDGLAFQSGDGSPKRATRRAALGTAHRLLVVLVRPALALAVAAELAPRLEPARLPCTHGLEPSMTPEASTELRVLHTWPALI